MIQINDHKINLNHLQNHGESQSGRLPTKEILAAAMRRACHHVNRHLKKNPLSRSNLKIFGRVAQ